MQDIVTVSRSTIPASITVTDAGMDSIVDVSGSITVTEQLSLFSRFGVKPVNEHVLGFDAV
jgi:hypothetical protein